METMALLFKVIFLAAIAHYGLALQCVDILPGVSRMARGIDITSLELFPEDISQSSGFRASLFDLTCDSGRKYKHPTIENFEFSVPDQIEAVNSVPGGKLNPKSSYHESIDEYKTSLSVKVGLDVNTVEYGDYSFSVGYNRAKDQILVQNQTVVETSAFVSAIQMDFKPVGTLKPSVSFVKSLGRLAKTYEKGAADYQDFLQTYGTHYFEAGMFGGYLLQRTEVDNRLFYELNQKEVDVNIQAKYMEMVGVELPINKKNEESRREFDSSTTSTYYYYGGQTSLAGKMNKEEIKAWWDSVPRDPWLFSGHIRPIETLIEDAEIRTEMQKAIRVKMAKAYLEDARKTLKLINKQRDHKASSLIAQLSAAGIPDEAKLAQLKSVVDQLTGEYQQLKMRGQLQYFYEQIEEAKDNELFCKEKVATSCDREKTREVTDSLNEARKLSDEIFHMLHHEKVYDAQEVKSLLLNANRVVKDAQTTKLGSCHKVGCHLCKSWVINQQYKNTCCTTHIKQLVDFRD